MEQKLPRRVRLYFYILGGIALFGIVLSLLLFAADRREERAPQYLLKDKSGQLALYAADGTGPLAEYDIYTRLLPEQDVLNLQQGLPVQNEADLQQKLEDYGL